MRNGRKKVIAFAVSLTAISVLTMAVPAHATVKANDTCNTAGATYGQATQLGDTPNSKFFAFTCTKVSKKLVWTAVKISAPILNKIVIARDQPYPGAGRKCVVNDCLLGSVGPAGGIVFYDAGSQKSWGRYLEAAPAGWSGEEDAHAAWCPMSDISPIKTGAVSSDVNFKTFTGSSLGRGASMTVDMLKKCPNGAALSATQYQGGGSKDWYLPSVDELNELCKFSFGQLKTTPDVSCDSVGNSRGDFRPALYFSSTQIYYNKQPTPTAYAFWFGKDLKDLTHQPWAQMNNEWLIRPVRAFSLSN